MSSVVAFREDDMLPNFVNRDGASSPVEDLRLSRRFTRNRFQLPEMIDVVPSSRFD